MSKIPFLAIGNDELKDNENVGEFETCPNCGEQHKVRYGEKVNKDGSRTKPKFLSFIDCQNGSYLVGINGKRLK